MTTPNTEPNFFIVIEDGNTGMGVIVGSYPTRAEYEKGLVKFGIKEQVSEELGHQDENEQTEGQVKSTRI